MAKGTASMLAARLTASVIVGLAPLAAAAQWSADGWEVRCAATSAATVLFVVPDPVTGDVTCIYDYTDDRGRPSGVIVPPEARAFYRQVLQETSDWYDSNGFGPPRVRRNDGAAWRLYEEYQDDPAVEPHLVPEPRVSAVEDGVSENAFLALVDPAPNLRGLHVETVLGFYSTQLQTFVFDFHIHVPEVVKTPGVMGALEAAIDLMTAVGEACTALATARVRPTVDPYLRSISRDTVAHEMFHAISRGYHDGKYARFIEEGLAEAYGRIHAAEVVREEIRHPLSVRIVEERFTTAPLISDGEKDVYDSAPFWIHLHDRVFASDGHGAFQRLLGDYDLTAGEHGADAVDAWLRAETGMGLGPHWTDFVRRISQEAPAAGLLGDLARCVDSELRPVPERGEHVFARTFHARPMERFTLVCIDLPLPDPDLDRDISIEVEGMDFPPDEIDVFVSHAPANLREGRVAVAPGIDRIQLLITIRLDDGDATTEAVQVPYFTLVVTGQPRGCNVTPPEIDRETEARLASFAGEWAADQHLMSSRHSNNCGLREASELGTGGRSLSLVWRDRQLFLEDRYRLIYLPDALNVPEVPGYDGTCGPNMVDPDMNYIEAEDWVDPVMSNRALFLVEEEGECYRSLMVSNDRMLLIEPFFAEQWLADTMGTPASTREEWWVRAHVRN